MWLMSEAKGVEKSVDGLARRLLLVNFAAIHSTSLASNNISSFTTVFANPSPVYRHSRKYCIAFLPTQNISNLFVKRSKLWWHKKGGRKLEWTRCTRLTVSYGRPSGWMA